MFSICIHLSWQLDIAFKFLNVAILYLFVYKYNTILYNDNNLGMAYKLIFIIVQISDKAKNLCFVPK